MDPVQTFIKKNLLDVVDSSLQYGQPIIMYRGESKKWKSPISSTLFRDYPFYENNFEFELKYYKQCFQYLYNYEKPFDSEVNLAFLSFLRHNNFPTRLIDITPSIETALFFAVIEEDEEDGVFYRIKGLDISYYMYNYENADINSVVNSDYLTKNLVNHYIFYKDTNIYNIKARRQKGWHIIKKGIIDGLVDETIISIKEKNNIREFLFENKFKERFDPDLRKILKLIKSILDQFGK